MVINLLRNALLAVDQMEDQRVMVMVHKDDEIARLTVEDTGQGLGGQNLETLQEQFHTT